MKSQSLASAATVLALALAGCGGSGGPSLSAFKSGFSADRTRFRQLGLDLEHAIAGAQSKTDAQLAGEIGALSKRAKQQASQLSRLQAPSKYQGELQKLVSALDAVGADLGHISTAATDHNVAAARSATRTLLSDAAKVKAADDGLSAGLRLPG